MIMIDLHTSHNYKYLATSAELVASHGRSGKKLSALNPARANKYDSSIANLTCAAGQRREGSLTARSAGSLIADDAVGSAPAPLAAGSCTR